MHEKINAGKVEVSKSKAEREAENMMQIGGGKKNKGKRRKEAAAETQYEEFNLDFAIVKKLAPLGIAPPTSSDDLEKTLKAVQEKKQWYEENGGSKLQEQIDELEKQAAEEEKFYEEDISTQAEEPPSRGRGRGRGGYRGGRGGPSRGRGRGGLQFQVRNEFDGEDDDEIIYSAPNSKPKKNK